MTTMLLEFLPVAALTGARTAAGSKSMADQTASGTGVNVGFPAPTGQKFHVYWESWFDTPNKETAYIGPDDFFLSRVPSYVNVVVMSFGQPQCTYTGIGDNIEATTGLTWSYSGVLLQETMALLKRRNPNVEFWVAIQQQASAGGVNGDPYNALGWGGMTAAHVTAWGKFAADFGVGGFSIDYECFSSIQDLPHHCQINAGTGQVECFTDTEMVSIIKLMRAGLPRPIVLCLDALHVGCYGQDEYQNAPPVGYNGGYNLCVMRDSVALAALDCIHIETYDAGTGYDPRTALRAYQKYYPTTPLYAGIRVGPPDGGGFKRTAVELQDYCNTVLMLEMAGAFMYSMLWDVVLPGRNGEGYAPFGNYGPEFPDSNIGAAVAAAAFGLGTDQAPAGSGYSGQQKNLRLINRPPWALSGGT